MILFLLQIYFNIFKKVFPLKNTIKRTFSALSRTSFSHCGKFSPKLKPYCNLFHAEAKQKRHLQLQVPHSSGIAFFRRQIIVCSILCVLQFFHGQFRIRQHQADTVFLIHTGSAWIVVDGNQI